MRGAVVDGRLSAPSLLTRTGVINAARSGWGGNNIAAGATTDTAADGSGRVTWANAGQTTGWYVLGWIPVLAGQTFTMMATALGPTTSRFKLQAEWEGVGGSPHSPTYMVGSPLDPATPTSAAWSVVVPGDAVLMRTSFYLNATTSASHTMWRMGCFLGRLTPEFWRLPEQ